MSSNARRADPPIHPMVIGFPIALFTLTIAGLLAYLGTLDTFYYRAAMVACLAGVTTALLALIPAVIDLLTLPRGSHARTTGLQHASLALLTTGMFAATGAVLSHGWLGRTLVDGVWALDATVPLAIGVAGVVTLVIAGALGWTLAQPHPTGDEPRFVRGGERTLRARPVDDLPAVRRHRPPGYTTGQLARR